MSSTKYYGWGLTCIGGAGVLLTAVMGYTYAPLVQSPPFRSPEAYRILFWHCLLYTSDAADDTP